MKFAFNLRPGGADAWRAVSGEIAAIKKALAPLSQKAYGTGVNAITFFVFVSGEIDQYPDKNGVGKILLQQKQHAGRAEITMHQDVWRKGEKHVAHYLNELVIEAVSELATRCEKAGVDLEAASLLGDLRKALCQAQ